MRNHHELQRQAEPKAAPKLTPLPINTDALQRPAQAREGRPVDARRRWLLMAAPAALASSMGLAAAAPTTSVPLPLRALWERRKVLHTRLTLQLAAEAAAEEELKRRRPAPPMEIRIGSSAWLTFVPDEHSYRYLYGDRTFRLITAEGVRFYLPGCTRYLYPETAGPAHRALVSRALAITEEFERAGDDAWRDSGLEEASQALNDTYNEIEDIDDAIIAAPALTASCLPMKVQALAEKIGMLIDFDDTGDAIKSCVEKVRADAATLLMREQEPGRGFLENV